MCSVRDTPQQGKNRKEQERAGRAAGKEQEEQERQEGQVGQGGYYNTDEPITEATSRVLVQVHCRYVGTRVRRTHYPERLDDDKIRLVGNEARPFVLLSGLFLHAHGDRFTLPIMQFSEA